MILAIDFDGVIHDPTNRLPGYKMGQPIPGALESVQRLLGEGHTIIVHTVRAYDLDQQKHVEAWLDYFQFPRHAVTAMKPAADVYLDDHAVRFTSWDDPVMLSYLHDADESNES